MIRHILFWKYTDNIKAEHKEEWALHFLQDSVATMDGKDIVTGRLCGGWNQYFVCTNVHSKPY